MSKTDVELRDDEGNVYSYNNIRRHGYLQGQPKGMELVIGMIHDKALALFARGDDEQAIALRDAANFIVDKLGAEMEANILEHESDHPSIIRCEDVDGNDDDVKDGTEVFAGTGEHGEKAE